MSTNIFNRDDGNKSLSYAQIDNDFDCYWESLGKKIFLRI